MRALKVLFVYKYLSLGGVEAVLRTRLLGLGAHGIEARAWFLHDLGGRSVFAGLEDRIDIGDEDTCVEAARATAADLLCTIDTEEVVAPLARRAPGLRWLLECHSGYVENLSYLDRLAAHPPAAVFVPSPEQARLIADRLPSGLEAHVVPNALSPEAAGPPSPFPTPPPRAVLAWVGRLDRLKNWPAFLDLGSAMARDGRDIELWLVGRALDVETADALHARARETGILPRLRWLAGISHDRMPRLFDAVRDSGGVLVSTSRRESFGLTVAEALARGCAVLVPEQPPFTDLAPGPESLFPPNRPEVARSRLARLLDEDGMRRSLGARGRESVLARFAPDVALAALAERLRALA